MDTKLPEILNLPKICDPRGNLSVIESSANIPFDIKRSYWIFNVPGGDYSNGHAYHSQEEFIVALSGSFDIVTSDGSETQRFHLSRSHYGLYIPALTWRKIDNFSTNSVVLVLSSGKFNRNEYIRDFEQFKLLKK